MSNPPTTVAPRVMPQTKPNDKAAETAAPQPTAQPENKPGQQHGSSVDTVAANDRQGQMDPMPLGTVPQSPGLPIDPSKPAPVVWNGDTVMLSTVQAAQIATMFANLAGALKTAGIIA